MRITFHIVILLSCLCLSVGAGKGQDYNKNELRTEFESHYETWKRHCERVKLSSLASSRLQSPDFQAIIKMGPEVLPLVAQKCIQDTNFHWIGWAWTTLTKMQNDPAINPWAKDSVKTWWEGGAELANERTSFLFREMKKAKKEGRTEDVIKTQRSIHALGILALETLIGELKAGDEDALPLINEILSDKPHASGKDDILKWWSKNKIKYILPKRITNKNNKDASQQRAISERSAIRVSP